MNITVDVDSKQLEQAMRKAPAKVTSKLNSWIRVTTLMSERESKQNVPPNVDTGQLENSIQSSFGLLKGEVKPTVKYAIFVHEGRKPGRMPPFGQDSNLNSWAERHGLNAFLVARSIAIKGTKPNKFMEKAFKTVKPIAEKDAQKVLDEIVRSI